MTSAMVNLFHAVSLPEMEDAALDVLRSGQIANGPKVAEFEKAFGILAGRQHVIAANDLTGAVTLALYLAGVRAGDSVATLAFSCLASNSPVRLLGARPVWIDVDPATMSMSLDDLAAKLDSSVKAVMVYHVAGYPADTTRISALCRDRGIPLIEDCNNAVGAVLHGRPVGAVGDYAAYSLYPNRQINGIDGGMVATPDAATAARGARLRRFGIDATTFRDSRGEINPESDVAEIGWSAALSHLNSAVALCQLDTVISRVERTRANAARLSQGLRVVHGLDVIEPVAGASPAFWGFLVLSNRRDSLLAHLRKCDIRASVLHHRNDLYSGFGVPPADLRGTADIMSRLIALPCGWWLSEEQIDTVMRCVAEFKEA